jgi:hypothetical protein
VCEHSASSAASTPASIVAGTEELDATIRHLKEALDVETNTGVVTRPLGR